MPGKIYLSTAYLPPAEYFAKIINAGEVYIESQENYNKQSYRNRCYILTVRGPQFISIPVYLGSFHKTRIRDIRIDYTKRWQQVHLGAFRSAYSSSPFFLYYFEIIEKIILRNYEFLTDLNMDLLTEMLKILGSRTRPMHTTEFIAVNSTENDFRYTIHPKKVSFYRQREYYQVFNSLHGFVPRLSIVDLIFNTGPDAKDYL